MADIIGRRWAFNATLFLVGIFMICAGASNNIYTYGGMFGVIGFASGGNVPVSSVVYLEFVPASGHYLLTILSAWWAVGAVVDAVSPQSMAPIIDLDLLINHISSSLGSSLETSHAIWIS